MEENRGFKVFAMEENRGFKVFEMSQSGEGFVYGYVRLKGLGSWPGCSRQYH